MEEYRTSPGTKIDLQNLETYFDGDIKKKAGKKQLIEVSKTLRDLQELLYAEGKHKLLVVLQGIDASGKDGTIKNVFGRVNPQGTDVANFKVPSHKELSHDYLWRIHQRTPASGEIVLFNRSHYEDVLVVRVNNLVSKSIWEKRYQHINEFERLLVDEGTTVLKFFLHMSKQRQARRFLARLDRPHKRWKFNPDDLAERKHWDAYQVAFEDMINETSTPWAPWYVIPSDRRWYRNLAIGTVIVDTLKSLNMQFPKEVADLDSYREKLAEMMENRSA